MRKTVLIVDDEAMIRDLIGTLLDPLGALILMAESGYEAIAMLEAMDGADLLIIDYLMKNGDGISLAHYCYNRKIPYILVSGYDPRDISCYTPPGAVILEKIEITDEGFLPRVKGMLGI